MTHILIIEDDQAMRDVMARALRQLGYEVDVAKDGAEGLALWDATRPDAVVTDVHMPNVDGIETILALRSRDPDVRIVAVSGGDSRASFLALDSASDLGATIVLSKPFGPDALASAVRSVLAPREP
ncbi:MAG: response regulator [Gemmatimonadaceae bacterium]|nr:response regulator [Gemmatimonadaceae bacterium]